MKWIVYVVSFFFTFIAIASNVNICKNSQAKYSYQGFFHSNDSKGQDFISVGLYIIESNDDNVDELLQLKSNKVGPTNLNHFGLFNPSLFYHNREKTALNWTLFYPFNPLYLIYSNIRC